MREAFEAWFQERLVGSEVIFPPMEDGEYTEGSEYDAEFYTMLQGMWMAYQAAWEYRDEN